MLYKDIKSTVIYTNFGYQPRENCYVMGNKKILLDTKSIEDYPKFPDDLYLNEEEILQILPANGIIPKLFECENPEIILEGFVETIIKVFDAPVLMAIAVGFVVVSLIFLFQTLKAFHTLYFMANQMRGNQPFYIY